MVPQRPSFGRRRPADLVPVPERLPIPAPEYQGETYYGREAIKPPHYGKLIAGYFFIGGIAAGSEIIAAAADLFGGQRDRLLVRDARYLALAGAALSPVLLTLDLNTPQRFFNMLRILRPTSAMSVGSWTLTGFGVLSGMTAAAQAIGDWTGRRTFRRLARWLNVPAAIFGLGVATYTGTLLVATSDPLWISGGRLLPAAFGASAISTSAAALRLIEHVRGETEGSTGLRRIGVAAEATELALTAALDKKWHEEGVAGPLDEEPTRTAYRKGVLVAGLVVPLMAHGIHALLGNRSRTLSLIAIGATLAGGLLFRHVLVRAGQDSARRPEDYFRYAQPAEAFRERQGTEEPPPETPARGPALEAILRAIAVLQQAIGQPARKVRDDIDDAEAHAVRARDTLIEQLRREGGSPHTPQRRQALAHVNLAISEIVGVDYPTHGIRQDAMKTACDELQKAAGLVE